MIKINTSEVSLEDLKNYDNLESRLESVYNNIEERLEQEKKGENHFLGWHNLPYNISEKEIENIKKDAEKIRSNSDYLVVIGIGGSYLGAKAVISALDKEDKILFLGNNISTYEMQKVFKTLEEKDYSVVVISKSGTTLEPAIAFRLIKEKMFEKYGEKEAIDRIYIVTDKEKGALKTFANKYNKETYILPENIGGRYSVLTAVGLFPIAVAGGNIDKLLEGARLSADENKTYNFDSPSYLYAALRYYMYKKLGKNVEILVNYEPRMKYFAEWFKQLFAESEGKESKGIFPTSALFTTDLHSIGQYIQEGERMLFETVLSFEEENTILVKHDKENLDGLNYLTDKSIDQINKTAMQATIKAHTDGGVPNILIEIESINEKTLGYLIYFFELACAISGILIKVNPFNQPGVEAYKTNMFKLLGRDK